MLFKFLQKPIHLTAFVSERFVFANEFHPIVNSSKFIPSWWKNTPKSKFNFDKFEPDLTVRSCSGIMNSFTNGYILPLWSDLAISLSKENDTFTGKHRFGDTESSLEAHSNDQFPNFYSNHHFIKLNSPWILETSESIKILYMDPFYLSNEPKPYVVPYGLVEPMPTTATHVFLFFPKTQDANFLIKSGTPLLHILPITERPIKFKTEVVQNRLFELKRAVQKTKIFGNAGLETRRFLKERKK